MKARIQILLISTIIVLLSVPVGACKRVNLHKDTCFAQLLFADYDAHIDKEYYNVTSYLNVFTDCHRQEIYNFINSQHILREGKNDTIYVMVQSSSERSSYCFDLFCNNGLVFIDMFNTTDTSYVYIDSILNHYSPKYISWLNEWNIDTLAIQGEKEFERWIENDWQQIVQMIYKDNQLILFRSCKHCWFQQMDDGIQYQERINKPFPPDPNYCKKCKRRWRIYKFFHYR